MSKKVVTFEVNMGLNILSKAKAKEFKSLSSKKERDKQNLFLAEGDKCVADTIGAFKIKNLICTSNWMEAHKDTLQKFEDKILITDKRGIEIISSLTTPSEVIAVFEKPESIESVPVLKENKLYLLLDSIQDPGNLGTIIRTCDWFGIYEIFASKNTVDVYSPKVVQSTMGSLSRVNVVYLDLLELIELNRNIKVIGTLLNGIPLNDSKNLKSGFLLMGNEGRGISEELKKRVDIPLTIPPVNTQSHPDSLNVSIATAIILSHLVDNKININSTAGD